MTEGAAQACDTKRLARLLARERPGMVNGELSAELIPGGKSNLTYALSDGVDRWILRRPPLGHVMATAHNMTREYTVMRGLAATAVPVPQMLLLHESSDVLGAPFFLMEYVDGDVLRGTHQTRRLGRERARRLSFALIDTLAALHRVDPDGAGLGDFGRGDGYLQRQVGRWRKQLDASHSRELPAVDELLRRLAQDVPVSPATTIVHGDFRLDNTIVSPIDDEIIAVVDWELSTLGDPLADLGMFAVYWDALVELPELPDTSGVRPELGFPASRELAEYYAARSGADLTRLPWYVGLGHLKIAAILEGIHYRTLQGKTVGTGFERIGDLVVPLAERGLRELARS